ncbi:alkaline phosphatase family protein [Amycolatopsis tucumanensis]|uniref:alkaline phosphatase family protein n=1 Tax=Amycolatopsis tucumanensis TaxID=401106 RepID=UPI001F1BB5AE|nr:alkaline phosphatase family protein [Amycolatopsis tucumanensis]MCF6428568.1 alkaline phosphatase family protein [Amycolatopsis tucumanensis]
MELPTLSGQGHLAEVVPSVLATLGVPGCADTLGLPEAAGACVLLIDGLGAELLRAHAADAPVLTELAQGTLTVGCPSTTVAGLAAIGTGVASGEHGMAGYTFEVPGCGVLNALRWREHPGGGELDLRPEDVQPLPTTFERAAAAGVEAVVVAEAKFGNSPLTRAVQRGAEYRGVYAMGDLAAETLRTLRESPGFCYAYHGQLDELGHRYGPGSPAWVMQLRQVDRLVESLVDGLPPGRLLAVVADHGMVALGEDVIDIDVTPELRSGVRVFGGDPRVRHVYTEPGATEDVLATWRSVLGSRAWVTRRDEAIAAGWLGPRVSDRVRSRFGDVIAAARDDFGMLRRTAEPLESQLIGQHGSMTSAEQLVPLAIAHR